MTARYTVGEVVQWDLVQGDTESLTVTWEDSNRDPVDLTGYAAEILDSDFNDIPATVTIPDVSTGQVLVSFAANQTLIMEDQYYRIRVSQGSFTKTLIQGRLNIRGPGD